MKKSYEAPVLVTEPVVMGVFGKYCEPKQNQNRNGPRKVLESFGRGQFNKK